jgi:hypothetical protein
MKTNFAKLSLAALLIFGTAVFFAGCQKENLDEVKNQTEVTEMSGHASQNQLEARVRAATAKYQRFEVAEADGYVLDPHCVEHPVLGGMGFHAVKFPLVDGTVDPLLPEVLVYEPMKNGRLRLVAVEYIVVAELWDPYNDGPPMFGNVEFADHRPPGSGGPPFPHYQLHVWLWKNNPMGMYFPFNPNVSCEFADHFEH